MPLIRDEHEERLARIEQMLEDLQREVQLGRLHREIIAEARLTRERTEAARNALRKSREESVSKRRMKAGKKG